MVTMADTSREPRQPRRLEKNRNMSGAGALPAARGRYARDGGEPCRARDYETIPWVHAGRAQPAVPARCPPGVHLDRERDRPRVAAAGAARPRTMSRRLPQHERRSHRSCMRGRLSHKPVRKSVRQSVAGPQRLSRDLLRASVGRPSIGARFRILCPTLARASAFPLFAQQPRGRQQRRADRHPRGPDLTASSSGVPTGPHLALHRARPERRGRSS
jgi:hypothetical protein